MPRMDRFPHPSIAGAVLAPVLQQLLYGGHIGLTEYIEELSAALKWPWLVHVTNMDFEADEQTDKQMEIQTLASGE